MSYTPTTTSKGSTMPFVPVTIKGGLPVIAEVWFSGPDYYGEYDAGVDNLYWQKRDGSRGGLLSQKLQDAADDGDILEQANDWLGCNCPTRRRNYDRPFTLDNPEWIEEGEYSEEYKLLNPRS